MQYFNVNNVIYMHSTSQADTDIKQEKWHRSVIVDISDQYIYLREMLRKMFANIYARYKKIVSYLIYSSCFSFHIWNKCEIIVVLLLST